MTDGPDALAGIVPVSRETEERLSAYVALLTKWQKAENLVAPSTLPQSGAGMWPTVPSSWRSFPRRGAGSTSAAAPGFRVWSSPSCRRIGRRRCPPRREQPQKCAFLRRGDPGRPAPQPSCMKGASKATLADWVEPVERITARALAPLTDLLALVGAIDGAGGAALPSTRDEILCGKSPRPLNLGISIW